MSIQKLSLLFIVINLLPITIQAQDISKWTIGIEIGINSSNSSEDTAPLEKSSPILPKIGVSCEYNIGNNIYLQSGIDYSLKGLKSKGNMENLRATIKLNQQVIQIPVLLNYKIPLNKFKLGLGCGMYYAYGLAGKTKAAGLVNSENIDIETNTFNNILKHQDLGWNFKLYSQYDHFSLNLSYEYGLINIGKHNVLGAPLDYKNKVLSLSIGYLF